LRLAPFPGGVSRAFAAGPIAGHAARFKQGLIDFVRVGDHQTADQHFGHHTQGMRAEVLQIVPLRRYQYLRTITRAGIDRGMSGQADAVPLALASDLQIDSFAESGSFGAKLQTGQTGRLNGHFL